MQNTETETETAIAIARAQEECDHIDKINELLREASPDEKRTIVLLVVARIKALPTPPYALVHLTTKCTNLVKETFHHIRHIGESEKGAIAIDILSELFPGEDEDDDDDIYSLRNDYSIKDLDAVPVPSEEEEEEEEEEEYGDKHIFAALEAGDLNKALRIAAALDEEADFAAFRAEAIASR